MILIHEHLFGDERPFAACHAATVAALPDGGDGLRDRRLSRRGGLQRGDWCAAHRPLR
jgi:hypothetical protein